MGVFDFGILVNNEGSNTYKYLDMCAWRGASRPVSAMSGLSV
jgi:hypothetical protein